MIDLGQLTRLVDIVTKRSMMALVAKRKLCNQYADHQSTGRIPANSGFAGAFRGMVFWAGGMVNIMQIAHQIR